MSVTYQLKKYIQYKLKAKDEHAIHSPFVFKLYTEVISNSNNYYAFDALNKIRKQLLSNQQTIEVVDLGAGSKKMSSTRKIADIAKYSVANKKYAELLFRLCNYFKPETILELGTSLGLSSLYIAQAVPSANITSIEGCPNTFAFAKQLIATTGVKNIETINQSFDDAFETTLKNKKFDLVYIDGNHTYQATVNYFKELLKSTDENSVLIFDDIYWTADMTKAWEEIKAHPAVTISIDLYKVGLVFFRKENKQKEHFCLRY
ncbi:MAG TPA: class I SAM-dependent methyltransferase [Bacteroidia bacterium]|jgi:predicted O-methyltransferase YrrM|nr:class I SAM-dependent methyltransferase [Bacteroidia bacterium]